jgi:cytoskeletal protein CcmA (bactofilin family)
MLGKKTDSKQTPTNDINFIAKGVQIKGNMVCESDLRYDGFLEGDLKVNAKLVLGNDAKIKGKVYALNADVSGNIDGNLEVGDTLTLRSTATVGGDIKTKKIIIESGAMFNGSCTMHDGKNITASRQSGQMNADDPSK